MLPCSNQAPARRIQYQVCKAHHIFNDTTPSFVDIDSIHKCTYVFCILFWQTLIKPARYCMVSKLQTAVDYRETRCVKIPEYQLAA